jgi:hypothetical protein
MQTRSKKAPGKDVKDVILLNFHTQERFNIGKASYDQALNVARASGLAPDDGNVTVVETNDTEYVVVWIKGAVYDTNISRSAPKPKMKATPILPEKLVGKTLDMDFAPRAPNPEVPGVLNALIDPKTFTGAHIRPFTPSIGSFRLTCEILGIGKATKSIIVRKDFYPTEMFATLFAYETFLEYERVKIIYKPLKLEDGAVYKIERIALVAKMAVVVHTWDGSTRRCGIEVPPTATKEEIVREAQRKLDDTKMEAPDMYTILFKGNPTAPPGEKRSMN